MDTNRSARLLMAAVALTCAECGREDPRPVFALEHGMGLRGWVFTIEGTPGSQSVTVKDTGIVWIGTDTLRGAEAVRFLRERAR